MGRQHFCRAETHRQRRSHAYSRLLWFHAGAAPRSGLLVGFFFFFGEALFTVPKPHESEPPVFNNKFSWETPDLRAIAVYVDAERNSREKHEQQTFCSCQHTRSLEQYAFIWIRRIGEDKN